MIQPVHRHAGQQIPALRFDRIQLPGGDTFSFAAAPGEVVQVSGGTPMARLRVLAIAAGYGFGGPGRCEIDGCDTKELDAAERAALRDRAVARVLSGAELTPRTPLVFAVAEEALERGASGPLAMVRAMAVLERMGLAAQAMLPPRALTATQVQLAVIARAMTCRPRLLVLERPETGLDTTGVARLMAALRHATRREGCCVVMSSQHPLLAAAADRRVVIAPRTEPITA